MASAAPPAWATTIVVDNRDQPCVEAQGFPLGSCYIPGALGSSPTREAASTQLPPPSGC